MVVKRDANIKVNRTSCLWSICGLSGFGASFNFPQASIICPNLLMTIVSHLVAISCLLQWAIIRSYFPVRKLTFLNLSQIRPLSIWSPQFCHTLMQCLATRCMPSTFASTSHCCPASMLVTRCHFPLPGNSAEARTDGTGHAVPSQWHRYLLTMIFCLHEGKLFFLSMQFTANHFQLRFVFLINWPTYFTSNK